MSAPASPRVAVFVEPTPNPNSLKFVVGRELTSGPPHDFGSAAEASASPLAIKLFEIPGVEGVFIGQDFVSVRKSPASNWAGIEGRAIEIIEEGVSSGRAVVEGPGAAAATYGDDPASVIRRILDREIRPAVASDGGDVVFQDYTDGVLSLKLVGACSGCPSSLMTLRMGIERRLREDVPDLKEVVSAM